MRTLTILICCLMLACCSTAPADEPSVDDTGCVDDGGKRPDDEQPTPAPDREVDDILHESVSVNYEYAAFFHNFVIRAVAAETLSGHDIEYGVEHCSGFYSIGQRGLGEYYSSYVDGEETVINIRIPFWHFYRTPGNEDLTKFFACEDANENGNNHILGLYERDVLGAYIPRLVARVDSEYYIRLYP